MNEKMKFVARLLDGEKMSELCREFGISRKTGYKLFNRYKEEGAAGLTEKARRPYRYANKLAESIEDVIINLKREKPTWGAPKLRERFIRLYPDIAPPAKSTIHEILLNKRILLALRTLNQSHTI